MSDTTTHPKRLDGTHDLSVESDKGEQLVNVALRGESDISTLEQLNAALDHVDLNGATAVHLDLTALDFADVATIRRLAAFAREAKRTGHDVKTYGASLTLRKVAALLDVHDHLGLG